MASAPRSRPMANDVGIALKQEAFIAGATVKEIDKSSVRQGQANCLLLQKHTKFIMLTIK
jgi:hypothetical protein